MTHSYQIQQVAVLGAGVMGAQIAAHCINAGFKTKLYELAADGKDKNRLVNDSVKRLSKLKPAPLAMPEAAQFIQAKNYDDDLAELKTCDLIIEAIGEKMAWKLSLYEKITPHLHDKAILVTNTSGLSINELAKAVPEKHRDRFCGVHFFNPPRYMHLAELIPAQNTNPQLLNFLESWLTQYLGKGVVRAKDTPNFIANRIGVFSFLSIMHHTIDMGLGLDEVDAITGPLIGRPKSATMRTMDVVGLDTMQHVIHTMSEQLSDDPWHAFYQLPEWLLALIQDGHLGQKTGQGLYRKQGKTIEVFDYTSGEYRPQNSQVDSELMAILKEKNQSGFIDKLAQSNSKQAQFLAACFSDLCHYTAYHLADIAENCRDVDLAISWGFGWRQGPFQTWQAAGVSQLQSLINQRIESGQALADAPLPAWLGSVDQFYKDGKAFSPKMAAYQAPSDLPVYHRQFFPEHHLNGSQTHKDIVFDHEGVQVWKINDIAIISFKSKANAISDAFIEGFDQALDTIGNQFKGVVIYQDNAGLFCAGADLKGVAEHVVKQDYNKVERMLNRFQQLVMRIKYSPIPVVAALRGKALGGGCELLMHCATVVASFESYVGLVELGVGLLPAGGGCKELALRASQQKQGPDLMAFLQPTYQKVAMADVAGSARQAIQYGFLKADASVVMHENEVLRVACERVNYLHAASYQPPLQRPIEAAGRDGIARIKVGLVNWLEGGFISDYDFILASHLAEAMCGGDIDSGQMVDESWYLHQERQLFMKLLHNEQTQARIKHILETGKPLRN